MNKKNLKFSLISDFTINPLMNSLKKQFKDYSLDFFIAPIDQVRQSIEKLSREDNKSESHIAIVWTRPQRQIYEFVNLCENNEFNKELIFEQVEDFSRYIRKISSKAKSVIVPIWTLDSRYRGNGILDFKFSKGISNVLMQMNLKLSQLLDDLPNTFLLNADQWAKVCNEVENEKMWYYGKIPYSIDIFDECSREVKAVYDAVIGKSKKLLVLDLDNTLWGGIAVEDGIENIKLGGMDYIGEAFVDFQKHLLELKNRGVLLAICSKNDEDVAMNIIDNHPEMVLARKDFVIFKINWEDKAQNIAELVSQLNLGLESAVFIDDSSFERERVSSALPEVFVPNWPEDPIYYVRALNSLKCFDKVLYSKEDAERTNLYNQERERKHFIKDVGRIENWLYKMDLEVSCEMINKNNIKRITQLLNKTNQFNLITRRMNEVEIIENCTRKLSMGIGFSARDKFGKYGLIGFCSLKVNDSNIEIKDFLLSCRAMGRGIEKAMLFVIKVIADNKLKKKICARYIPTEKNSVSLQFLLENGFKRDINLYCNNELNLINLPRYIKLFNNIDF